MKLDLNVSSRPFVNRAPHVILLVTLTVLTVGFTAWNLSLFLSTRSETRAVEGQLDELRAQRTALAQRRSELVRRLSAADLGELTVRVDAANSVLSEKSLAWSLLLSRLAGVLPWSGALRSIRTHVVPEGISLNLDMRAKGLDFYLEFIDALEASPCFAEVYPSGDIQTSTGEFEASLSLLYDPQCGTAPPAPPSKGKAVRGKGSRTRSPAPKRPRRG